MTRNRWKHDEDHLDPIASVKMTREALSILDIPKQQVILPVMVEDHLLVILLRSIHMAR
jgi:hypothetical protein